MIFMSDFFFFYISDTFHDWVQPLARKVILSEPQDDVFLLKFGYSEKATKFKKIFHQKFDTTQ